MNFIINYNTFPRFIENANINKNDYVYKQFKKQFVIEINNIAFKNCIKIHKKIYIYIKNLIHFVIIKKISKI